MVRLDSAPVTQETLAPVAAAMSAWGPDGHGQWRGEAAGLGHLMLHVTPESLHERLPATIRVAPHLIITADARIDNRDELFDDLGVATAGRSKTPDSSLILLAYERWGAECVKRLLGDFAFAIWDTRERKLFCARDLFGCKPFVYFHDGKQFVFASDVKGVLASLYSPQLNEPLLAAYLQINTYPAEKRLTFFTEIVKLPPAHTLTLSGRELYLSRYWSPENVAEHRGDEANSVSELASELGSLFRQAVDCRLRSAFPIGSHLSGGLDSSSITAEASRVLNDGGKQLTAFSWSPPPTPDADKSRNSEYARIDAICRPQNLLCEFLPGSKASLIATFRRDFTVEPVAMMPREANVQARAKERQLRVMLSGWGGDEAVTVRVATSPAEFLASGRLQEFRISTGPHGSRPTGIAGIVRDLIVPRLPDYLYGLTGANPYLAHQAPCIQAAFAQRYEREVKELRVSAPRKQTDIRRTMCSLLEIGHITMRLEHWATSGAANQLEYRYPMLDKRLVEFALSIPASPLRSVDRRRVLFLRAMGELLPASVDWAEAKTEPETIGALKREYFQAHTEWAQHLRTERSGAPANRLVDSAKIRRAVEEGERSGRLASLSGVREAFGCFAINALGIG